MNPLMCQILPNFDETTSFDLTQTLHAIVGRLGGRAEWSACSHGGRVWVKSRPKEVASRSARPGDSPNKPFGL